MEGNLESSQRYIQWKQQRSRTRILANILILFSGIESQCIEVTSIFYFHQSFGLSLTNAAFYFTISETIFSINNAISGISFGRYVDKTRSMRAVFLLNIVILGFGNLMYSIPYALWWVLVGRFLCGINESLQTTICGEFRRCYNDDELINVLSWYEILYAVGINLGPGLPVLFSFVNIHIGWWTINRNNIIQVITALSVFIIFIFGWFYVIDLSKELDSIKAEFLLLEEDEEKDRESNSNSSSRMESEELLKHESSLIFSTENDRLLKKDSSPKYEEFHMKQESLTKPENKESIAKSENKIKQNSPSPEPARGLMKWKDLLQFDILLLAFSYAFMRCTVSISVTDVTLVSTKTFGWKMDTLAWLHIILGSSSYLIITLFVKFEIFKGRKTIFYSYVVAISVAFGILSLLMLPKALDFPNLPSQIAFGGSVLFLKCFVYFQAQSSGKFLVFNTVSLDNANFVDGFRSFVGNFFRLCVRSSLFYFFLYPEYFVPPMFLIGLLIFGLLLNRRTIHVGESSPAYETF